MNPEVLAALEALLFASDTPLEVDRIAEVLELSAADAEAAVAALRQACEAPGRGLAVAEVAGGIRLVTRPELAPVLVRLQRLRVKSRLSRAALETLAIIAYRQPISRPEIEQLRGVGAEAVLAHLLERRLVRVVGRKPTPGRPLLYGTTREFLEHFGLRDLGDLPPVGEPERAAGPAGPALAPVSADAPAVPDRAAAAAGGATPPAEGAGGGEVSPGSCAGLTLAAAGDLIGPPGGGPAPAEPPRPADP